MTETALTPDEILVILRERYANIPQHKVFYALREYRVVHVYPTTVNVCKACLAIHTAGLPCVTQRLVRKVMQTEVTRSTISGVLNRLGDRNVLIYKRRSEGQRRGHSQPFLHAIRNVWTVHPAFLKVFERGQDESREYTVEVTGDIARESWAVRAQRELLKHPEKATYKGGDE